MIRKDTVRLTVDFPSLLHTHLKVAAAKKGKSMRQYIIESLMLRMEEDGEVIDNTTFRDELKKMTKKDSGLMKDLSDQ